jgi:hypothetical protein
MGTTRRMMRLAGLATVAAAAGAAYSRALRPWMTSWGATPAEYDGPLPGDEIVPDPKYQSTHAVTVAAPVEQVWPWIVQLGQGRGGMYSYDWLENATGLDMHSADEIVPELQHLAVGDRIRLTPEDADPPLQFVVARLEAPHTLVLGPHTSREDAFRTNYPYPTWTFVVSEVDDRTSRLLVRFRSDFRDSPTGWALNKYALEPVHFAMERRMLLGIKERAERRFAADDRP